MDNKELVYKILATSGKPLKNNEISELSGLEKGAVEKAMKNLKTEDKIFSPKRCFWQIK